MGHPPAGNGIDRDLHGALDASFALAGRSAPSADRDLVGMVAPLPADVRVGRCQADLEQLAVGARRIAGRQHVEIAHRAHRLLHYWTQPLPIWTSWYATKLPQWFQKLSVVFVFVVELGLPWLIFGPRLSCKAVRGLRRDHAADAAHGLPPRGITTSSIY